MTATGNADRVLIVEPDPRVRRALADLLGSTADLVVLAACATVDEAERACRADGAHVALVSVRQGTEAGFTAIARLAQHVPVVAVAPTQSIAGRAVAAGAAAFYDQDGDTDALVAVVRDVIDQSSKEA